MNSKPASSPLAGPVSKAIASAERSAKTGAQITPDGFLGPTTILFVTAKADADPALKQMIDVITLMKKAGIRIFIASPMTPPMGFELKKLADKFIQIPNVGFSFSTLFYLRKQIRKHKVNVVHSYGRGAGVYSRLLGGITNVPIVHSPPAAIADNKMKFYLDIFLAQFKYDAVFSTQTERLNALQVGTLKKSTQTYVIDNAIDLAKYPLRKHAATAFGKIDFAKPETHGNIRIGAYLRADSRRGHSAFLKLVKEAAQCGQFTCAGVTRATLREAGPIPANLEIIGPVADPMSWLYSLDVFVSPSTALGQVATANEAIAAGAICILSKIPSHENFQTHKAALLFDAKSTANFIEQIRTITSDRSMRDMLLGNSRYMLERFNDADSFRLAYLDVYRTSVKRAAGLIL